MAVHIPTVTVPYEACRIGSLRPRPPFPARRRRPGGCGATTIRTTTYEVADMHVRNGFPCTCTPTSHVRLWIGIGRAEHRFRITASRSKNGRLQRVPVGRLVSGAVFGKMAAGSIRQRPVSHAGTTAGPRVPRTRRFSSHLLTPALIAMVHDVPAGRSAIRWCRTAAAGHRNQSRSLAVRPCGSSSSRWPSAASPKAGRCARTPCTRGRVLGWRPTPNYCPPPRPRSSRRISRRFPIDDTSPWKSRCAPLALKASVSFLLS